MQRNAVILAGSSSATTALAGSTVGHNVTWNGGRGAIVIVASQYATGLFLAMQAPDGSWININGTTYSANQVTAYDLPAGQYRLVSQAGSSVALSARLCPVYYGG
jgi:hypothetical protein